MADEAFYHCIVCRNVKYLEGNESERTMECKECKKELEEGEIIIEENIPGENRATGQQCGCGHVEMWR